MKRPRVDVNLEELDQIIDRGTHAPAARTRAKICAMCSNIA